MSVVESMGTNPEERDSRPEERDSRPEERDSRPEIRDPFPEEDDARLRAHWACRQHSHEASEVIKRKGKDPREVVEARLASAANAYWRFYEFSQPTQQKIADALQRERPITALAWAGKVLLAVLVAYPGSVAMGEMLGYSAYYGLGLKSYLATWPIVTILLLAAELLIITGTVEFRLATDARNYLYRGYNPGHYDRGYHYRRAEEVGGRARLGWTCWVLASVLALADLAFNVSYMWDLTGQALLSGLAGGFFTALLVGLSVLLAHVYEYHHHQLEESRKAAEHVQAGPGYIPHSGTATGPRHPATALPPAADSKAEADLAVAAELEPPPPVETGSAPALEPGLVPETEPTQPALETALPPLPASGPSLESAPAPDSESENAPEGTSSPESVPEPAPELASPEKAPPAPEPAPEPPPEPAPEPAPEAAPVVQEEPRRPPPPGTQLRSLTGGQSFLLDEENTIGRAKGNSIVLSHPTVADAHARLSWNGRTWEIVDLGSKHGTQIKGSRLKPGQPTPVWAIANVRFGEQDMVLDVRIGLPR